MIKIFVTFIIFVSMVCFAGPVNLNLIDQNTQIKIDIIEKDQIKIRIIKITESVYNSLLKMQILFYEKNYRKKCTDYSTIKKYFTNYIKGDLYKYIEDLGKQSENPLPHEEIIVSAVNTMVILNSQFQTMDQMIVSSEETSNDNALKKDFIDENKKGITECRNLIKSLAKMGWINKISVSN